MDQNEVAVAFDIVLEEIDDRLSRSRLSVSTLQLLSILF